MFTFIFQAYGNGKKVMKLRIQREDICYTGFSFRNSPGFVHYDCVNGMSRLKSFSRFDKNSVFSPLARTDHDGNWRCQSECTRARNNKNGNAERKCEFKGSPH